MNCPQNGKSASDSAQSTKVLILKKLSPTIVLVVMAIGNNFASAQDMTPLGVEWRCVQQNDESFHVLCMPKPAGGGSVPPEVPGGIIKGSLPGRGDMRPVAERGLAEVFSAKAWSVPLYARPSDNVMASRLLQAVLCDTAPYCSVRYRSN